MSDLLREALAVDGVTLHDYPQAVTGRKTCRRFVAGGMRVVLGLIPKRVKVLDFGGGRYEESVGFMREHGHTLLVYDPYNRSMDHNLDVLADHWSAIVCNNVLNVLTDDVIDKVIGDIVKLRRGEEIPVFFTVYERDGDGVGKFSGNDEYQRNEKIRDYIPRLQRFFKSVTKVKDVIVCK